MPSRADAIEAIESHFDSNGFRKDLATLVAVPSSSREEEYEPDVKTYLEAHMVPAFEAMGFNIERHENPMLAARTERACPCPIDAGRPEDDDGPVLGFGRGLPEIELRRLRAGLLNS